MKIYLNGPVDAVAGTEAFTNDMAKRIESHGHTVVIGRDIWTGGKGHAQNFRTMVRRLLTCDSICHLPGSELSPKACEVQSVAARLGLEEWVLA